MTIIVSYQRKGFVLMGGDLMISSDRERTNPIDLPTRFSKLQPDPNLFLLRLSQKVVIIDDHLAVAWAGRKNIAGYLVGRIASGMSQPYSAEKILALIDGSGLLEEDLESVSFIFFGLIRDDQDDKMFVQDYRTGETIVGDHEKIKYAGSGISHFLKSIAFNMKGSTGQVNTYEEFVGTFITRLAIALYQEIVSDVTHKLFYGGGFELLLLNPIEKRFVKVPMTFVFWEYGSRGVELTGPILTLNYDANGYLFLHRIVRTEQDKWTRKSYAVGNILSERNSDVPPSPPPDFNTFFSVHYLISTERNDKVNLLIKKGEQKNIEIRYSPESGMIDIQWTSEFIEEIKCATS